MTKRDDNCGNCQWFKSAETEYRSGGFCNWRAPMNMRSLLWGLNNERIGAPEKEWCNQHSRANGETGEKK